MCPKVSGSAAPPSIYTIIFSKMLSFSALNSNPLQLLCYTRYCINRINPLTPHLMAKTKYYIVQGPIGEGDIVIRRDWQRYGAIPRVVERHANGTLGFTLKGYFDWLPLRHSHVLIDMR